MFLKIKFQMLNNKKHLINFQKKKKKKFKMKKQKRNKQLLIKLTLKLKFQIIKMVLTLLDIKSHKNVNVK